ncbi:hypothetical protein BAMA_16175 [Bacillus manliponensis]|uniref:RNA polymerase sigma factor 70 region 4 type 2 domain-containing protein n=1 Tax=Bacillus manliponensis TaxID=574376 RepID=A0A073JSD0_9BACI|nr:sigma-70 family RNA polymerase sigma factor [Bacillus manliponensis]KEK17230.1 hypothetical protein BAMA_16175 [Bacillus manliponensis]
MKESIKDVQDLIIEYKETLGTLEQEKEAADDKTKEIIAGMISDVRYALEWMCNGRKPGNVRGIERRAAYEREKSVDPLLMQRYFRSTETPYEWDNNEKESVVSEWDRIRLEDALSTLTENEKEVYMMHKGYCLSMDEISKMLQISKGTVQKYIQRADIKISRQIKESLFCMSG